LVVGYPDWPEIYLMLSKFHSKVSLSSSWFVLYLEHPSSWSMSLLITTHV